MSTAADLLGITPSGALIKFPAPVCSSPAAAAAQSGDVAALRALPAESLGAVDETANTPLIWAANGSSSEAVEFLVQSGVDLNARGYLGATALARAARLGSVPVVQALLAAGADPNTPNDKLQYPLHFAAFKQHPEVVRVMLESGACDTTVTDRKGRTPAEDTKDESIRDMIVASRAAL